MPPALQISSRQNSTRADVNRLDSADRAAHDWYRFVLSFPPHLVREYLARFGVDGNATVLDPFCGTGTTLVECKKNGIPSIGIEAHPVSYFASVTKLNWSPDPDELECVTTSIATNALNVSVSAAGIWQSPATKAAYSRQENQL
jgi:hypothetical protein